MRVNPDDVQTLVEGSLDDIRGFAGGYSELRVGPRRDVGTVTRADSRMNPDRRASREPPVCESLNSVGGPDGDREVGVRFPDLEHCF